MGIPNLDQQQAFWSPSGHVALPHASMSLTPPVLLLEPLALALTLEVEAPVVTLELVASEDDVVPLVVVTVVDPGPLDVVEGAPPAPTLP
jgi:hypothetical protein